MNHRRQLRVFATLLAVYASTVFAAYTWFVEDMAASAGLPMPDLGVPDAVLGLANAGLVLVAYGLMGLAGYGFARKLGLPGFFREDGDWRGWALVPAAVGLTCGLVMVVVDTLFAPLNGFGPLPHPGFPFSVLASLGAGIGEEIAFRGLVFGLWAYLFSALLGRFAGRTAALWLANAVAALLFGVSHFGTVFLLTGATSPDQLGPVLVVEVLLVNAIIGIPAGQRYMRDGLVAAMGVHFWADVAFHVVWGGLT